MFLSPLLSFYKHCVNRTVNSYENNIINTSANTYANNYFYINDRLINNSRFEYNLWKHEEQLNNIKFCKHFCKQIFLYICYLSVNISVHK